MKEAQRALDGGLHAVLTCDYELGAGLHRIAPWPEHKPTARVLLFAKCKLLSRENADDWLADIAGDAPAGIAARRASEDASRFAAAIERIHAWLEAGDAYQMNHTFR